jgi:hypothetical protein
LEGESREVSAEEKGAVTGTCRRSREGGTMNSNTGDVEVRMVRVSTRYLAGSEDLSGLSCSMVAARPLMVGAVFAPPFLRNEGTRIYISQCVWTISGQKPPLR